jgi:hypothetical protein
MKASGILPLILAICPVSGCASPCFTEAERAAVVAYWSRPERLKVSAPPEAAKTGPFVVRQTPEGSAWLLAYQRAVAGAAKMPLAQDTPGAPPEWARWLEMKTAYDQAKAREAADSANRLLGFKPPRREEPETPPPGPIPGSLLEACGNPPRFAAAVAPLQATVTFEDGEAYTYTSHVSVRPGFRYFRFPQGTVAYGPAIRNLPEAERDAVFAAAGMSESEQRVVKAISKLEGGFESVNTYDTGYVSVGFIQFTTGETGQGSLCSVLATEKTNDPARFQADFRAYGVDVTDDGTLAAVDPDTGAELTGADAVRKVVEDRRLTAVFQRAGRHSIAFRVAQVLTAKSVYWPADIEVSIPLPDGPLSARAGDFIKSEAGLATLFDRKVNRGNIRPFEDEVAKVMKARGLRTAEETLPWERDIVAAMTYRVDFLSDPSLGQPPAPPVSVPTNAAKD